MLSDGLIIQYYSKTAVISEYSIQEVLKLNYCTQENNIFPFGPGGSPPVAPALGRLHRRTEGRLHRRTEGSLRMAGDSEFQVSLSY